MLSKRCELCSSEYIVVLLVFSSLRDDGKYIGCVLALGVVILPLQPTSGFVCLEVGGGMVGRLNECNWVGVFGVCAVVMADVRSS